MGETRSLRSVSSFSSPCLLTGSLLLIFAVFGTLNPFPPLSHFHLSLSLMHHLCFTLVSPTFPPLKLSLLSSLLYGDSSPLPLPPFLSIPLPSPRWKSQSLCLGSSSSQPDSKMYIKAQPRLCMADLWHLTDRESLGTQDSSHGGDEKPRGGRLLPLPWRGVEGSMHSVAQRRSWSLKHKEHLLYLLLSFKPLCHVNRFHYGAVTWPSWIPTVFNTLICSIRTVISDWLLLSKNQPKLEKKCNADQKEKSLDFLLTL